MPQPSLTLTVLGSGTCTPNRRRGNAGYLVESAGRSYLMDSGSGTIGRLALRGLPVHDLDALFYTHLHLDHTADLFPILFALRNAGGLHRERPLPIYGPPGFLRFFHALMEVYGSWVVSPAYQFEVMELGPDAPAVTLGDLHVEAFPVRHSAGSVGYRWTAPGPDGDLSLAFTGDASEGMALAALIHRVDLAVMECSAPDEAPLPAHLTPSVIGHLAREAQVGRLVLTHFYPPYQDDPTPAVTAVRALVDCPVVAAEDGDVFVVG